MSDQPQWSAVTDWVDTWVLPYFDREVLWPVLIALLGHVVVIVVPLMLAVYRVGSLTAVVGVLFSLSLSVAFCWFEVRHKGRPGSVVVAIALTWAASIGLAVLCERTGLL